MDSYNQWIEMVLSISQMGCFLFNFTTSLDWLGHGKEVIQEDILTFMTLGRKHSVSHHYTLTAGVLQMFCIRLSNFPSVLNLLSFDDEWMLNFSNAFSASVEMNMWLFFSLLIQWILLAKFWILNQS